MPTPIPGTFLVAADIGPDSTDPQHPILLEQLAWLTGPVARCCWVHIYDSGSRQGEIVASSDPEMIGQQWDAQAFFNSIGLVEIFNI